MRLTRLSLRDFRSYEAVDLEVPDGILLFEGSNASGKTTLLEAVYYLATLRSFRTRRPRNLIRWEASEAFVGGRVGGEMPRVLRVTVGIDKRRATIDGRPVQRFADYYGAFQCVVFSPEDQVLVSGGSAGRRAFVDMLLAEIEPGYLAALQEYTHALRSRNRLLKGTAVEPGSCAAFERILADRGARIIEARTSVIRRLGPAASGHYEAIADGRETMSISYRPSVPAGGATAEQLQEKLAASRPRDEKMGTTLVGPHRDRFDVAVAGRAAADFASQGQARSIALGLRLAETELVRERFDEPILLVDDVFAQLDEQRRSAFLARMRPAGQVWITCAGAAPVGADEIAARFRVEPGRVTACG